MSHPKSHPKVAAVKQDRNHHLQEREGWWYFVMEWQGRRIRRATKTMEVVKARILRDEWMDEIWRNGMLRAAERAPVVPTVAAVLERFEAGPLESGTEHRRRVANIVRSMLRRVKGDGVDLGVAPVTALNDALIGAWRRSWLEAAQAVEAAEGQAAAARMKASGNSLLNQAAALFSPEAVQLFKDHGLEIAGAEEWRAACRARGFKVASARARFVLPSAEVVQRIFEGLPSLAVNGPVQPPSENGTAPEVQRRNMAIAVGLMLGGGLRKGEVSQVPAAAVTGGVEDWILDTKLSVKDGTGYLRQRVLGWVWRRIGVKGDGQEAKGFALAGHETERNEAVFRRVAEWMRGLGWNAQKVNHGLRDLAISCVIAETSNPYEGQIFGRHASVTVTEKHYGHFAREVWLKELVAKMKAPGDR